MTCGSVITRSSPYSLWHADYRFEIPIRQKRLPVPIGDDQVERNGVLSNSTGFPAITI